MTAASPAPLAIAPNPPVPASDRSSLRVVGPDGRAISAAALEQLERLDDTVFAALAGDAEALDRAADEWRRARTRFDGPLLDEARSHYVGRARSRWRRSQRDPADRLASGFAALHVLRLFDEAN